MKDWFDYQGSPGISGSRDATREAFRMGLIAEGEAWMEMIKSRNLSSHTYNLETAIQIANAITTTYRKELKSFLDSMEERAKSQ